MSDNGTPPPFPTRPWLVAIGSAAAVVAVVLVVGLVVGSGRHRSAASSSGVFPSPTTFSSLTPSAVQTVLPSASPGVASNEVPVPSPTTATAQAVDTATPLPTPMGPSPTAPAGGWYLCEGDTGMATCADSTGTPIRQFPVSMAGPGDVTYNQGDGYVYYREVLTDAHGNVERISRVALTGGAPQILVQGPDMSNETQVSFGTPVSSPDGSFLAYWQMTLAFNVPGGPTHAPIPGAQTVGPPGDLSNEPTTTRLVQIKIQNLRDLKTAPVIVPLSMVNNSGPLLGWSADGKQLFLVGPGGKVESLNIGSDGVPAGINGTVFDPAAVVPGCQDPQTLMTPSGDFFVVASCAQTINVVKVHEGAPQPFGMLVNTKGWEVNTAALDTTGRVLALSWFAPPGPPQCVSVDGSARIIDGVPTAIQLETTPGCMTAGGPAAPPPSSPPS